MARNERQVRWVGSSLRELRALPEAVKHVAGFALYQAQRGDKHVDAKPLKGFGGASVLEIVIDERGDTYRIVYTTGFRGVIYVLCAFQKKAPSGKRTPVQQVKRIRSRLKTAEDHYWLNPVGRR